MFITISRHKWETILMFQKFNVCMASNFGGKLDVSNASKITKTASIIWLHTAALVVFLQFAVAMNIDSVDPLRTMPDVLMCFFK